MQSSTLLKAVKTTLLCVFTLIYSFFGFTQTVVNGSFNSPTGNSVTPAGWTNVLGYNPGTSLGVWPSVDVCDINFTAYFNNAGVAVSPSPDGGTWTGISSIPPDFENEAVEQVVSGFTVGQTYELKFYAANFGGTPFIDPGVVTGYINGTAVAVSPVLNLVPNVWTTVTGTFVASATSMTLQLDAIHTTGNGGAGGYYDVDGVTITPINNCLAGNTPPNLSQTSTCLASGTFDLTTITCSNTPAGTTMNWYSATPASAAGLLATPNAVGTGTYYAAFYDATNDCYSPTTAFIVNPDPVADFSNSVACEGSPVTFTDLSTVTSGSITGWSWDFGDGNSSNLQNPSHTYASGSSHTVTLTVTTAAGCTNTITQTVTLNVVPTADFTAQAGCANNPVSFTDQSTVSSGTITGWSWNFGDGNSSNIQNPTHQYAAASSYTVTLTVTSDMGCTNSFSQQVATTAPNASFTATTACANSNTQFTDQTTLSAGTIVSWSWDFGDGNNSNLQNPGHTYTTSGNYTVTLTVTSDAGCTDIYTQQVTVSAIPVANFNVTGACSGVVVPFTDLSTVNPGTISSWNWNFGDGGSSSVQNPTHIYNAGGTFNVTLNVTSNAGCVNSVTQPVVIVPTPNASFTTNPTEPDIMNPTVQFLNNSTNALTYSWNFGGEGTSNQTNPSFTFAEEPGSYTITLITYNGVCSDTAHATVLIKDVLIYYIPNTFTPDADEFNQTFQPVFTNGYDPYDFNMKIFNRWGELIFESNDASIGWDGTYQGKLVPDGTYTWAIEFKTTMSDERVSISGHVTKLL